nr:DNA cytosine methyltransferase [uncultured Desulfobacter sp.]
MNKNAYNFLDLFAGAGGLSEGFIRSGFKPIAHVEADKGACNTLRTRTAYHYLKQYDSLFVYFKYLRGEISRREFYNFIPEKLLSSIINEKIEKDTLKKILSKIDLLLEGEKPDLIIGGPPCQAYSLVGRSRDKNRMVGDSRNYLYKYYGEFLKYYAPKYFVFENVVGLLSAKDIDGNKYYDGMVKLFKRLGYRTESKIITANDYGIPQNRRRIILVGKKGNDNFKFPEPNKEGPNLKIRELIGDLPPIQAGGGTIKPVPLHSMPHDYLTRNKIVNGSGMVTWHIARPNTEQDLEIYRIAVNKWSNKKERLDYNDLPERLKTHKNRKSFTDRFKVVAYNMEYSHTIMAHLQKDGHYYIHPDIHQNRSISPREAARIQTFPDDYYFEGHTEKHSRAAAYRQIGNAVPVLLGQKIAEKLKESIDNGC